jgi:hypothetical protein
MVFVMVLQNRASMHRVDSPRLGKKTPCSHLAAILEFLEDFHFHWFPIGIEIA